MKNESYQLFKSAEGDINSAIGTFYYDDYDCEMYNAAGDITNGCKLNLPYPDRRLQMLMDQVSAARNREALAESNRAKAYTDYRDCKSRLFCRARPKQIRLKEKEVLKNTATLAYKAVKDDFAQAESANKSEQSTYDKCLIEEKRLQKEQAEMEALAAEQERIHEIESRKVATAGLETKKDYAVYALVGLGTVSILFFGYLLIK